MRIPIPTMFAASLFALASGAASAQTITIQPSNSAFSGASPIATVQRIESSMSFIVTAPATAEVEELKKRSEAARRAIYEMAASECATLSDVFKADCRLLNVRASSSTQRGSGEGSINANGSASYELTPKR